MSSEINDIQYNLFCLIVKNEFIIIYYIYSNKK